MWELVLTADPLVVMASNPAICSSTVQYLTTLIYPLNYAADYRPFYTIHDSDFKDITAPSSSGNVPLPNVLLGVTNPFFGKALKHWPHIVKLGDTNTLSGLLKSPSKSSSSDKTKNMSKFKLDSKPGLYSSTNFKPSLDKVNSSIVLGLPTYITLKDNKFLFLGQGND